MSQITERPFFKACFNLKAGGFNLNLGRQTAIMGILNLTPDSFSQDGLLRISAKGARLPPAYRTGRDGQGSASGGKNQNLKQVIARAEQMVKDGADILDIGGESTRPYSRPVSIEEELRRTIPVIKILAKKIKAPISIDTYKNQVAEQALDNGASIVNDISSLSDKKMPGVIKKYKALVVLMHMQGDPANMQNNPRYKSLIPEIINYLKKRVEFAVDSGLSPERIIIDPGIGFGKAVEHNLEIINRLRDFAALKRPVLIGPSRKSFIGKIINKDVNARVFGTSAAISLAIANGAHIVRVHDICPMKDVVRVTDAILNKGK